ncbi:MAG: hypothetical protein ACFFFB_15405 [Candidatus Heimdallarchaeota archaeon]
MPASTTEMLSYFFEDPKESFVERKLNNTKIQYFYLNGDLTIKTNSQEILNGCLLSGNVKLRYKNESYDLQQFDFFLMPPETEVKITYKPQFSKLCVCRYKTDKIINFKFIVKSYSPQKFLPRGEFGSKGNITTYRTVWTAIKNSFFMSGFTKIPNESLRCGVITSVNLELNADNNVEIYPHIHPEYPEVYIMCIDDDKYAITQYLINQEGDSVCKNLSNGDGLFFPGSLGHSNFARPLYKKLNYVMYMWIIPTFGETETVNPKTLRL